MTGEFHSPKSAHPTFPKVFGKHMLEMAENDPHFVAITPAMPVGSSLDGFMKKYPDRCIDVGIADGLSVSYSGVMGQG